MLRAFISAFFILLFLFINISVQAQTNDHILWASIKLQKKIDSKTSVAAAPIFRYNEDLTNYQNSSIDLSIKRSIGKGFALQFLSRTWFVPDADNRQFLWFDVIYGKEIGDFKIGSSVRMHWALNVHDNKDADFIRWKNSLTYQKLKKFKPFINIEPWIRLNSDNEIQRFRIEPGFKYMFNKQWSLVTMLRREESRNLEPSLNVNIYVVTLAYSIP